MAQGSHAVQGQFPGAAVSLRLQRRDKWQKVVKSDGKSDGFVADDVGKGNHVPEESPCAECRNSRLLPALLAEGWSRPADCGNAPSPPPWLHRDKLAVGQAVFHRYFLSIFVSNLVGLLCLLAIETIVKVLAFTGRSYVPSSSYRRYLSTINHLRQWYSSDIFLKESSAYKSIQLVRRMHTSSHLEAQKSQFFISQVDMVVTQWAFFGLVLTQGSQFGVRLTREEEDGLTHLWRIIGYLLGIEEKYILFFSLFFTFQHSIIM
nr:uncharacterized protein LOC113816100 [Penaeus vannamei]